jgi:thiol-disulfide isomerase/thioredoxin
MNKKTIITALLALVSMAGQGQETPQDWFKTDTITVQGRIEDYDAKKFGFTTMKCHLYDVIVKDNSTLLLEIEPDGTFAKSFPISYPMKLSFTATEKSKVGFEKIPFFARPGETIDITIKPNEYGQYECHYNSGSSKDVERWLKSDLQLLKMCSRLYDFKGEFGEANIIAEQLWQDMAARIDSVGSCDHFTPIEMQLAQAEMQNHFAFSLIDYAFEYAERLMPWQQQLDGSFRQIVTDSTALLLTKDVNNYRLLKRVDFDNPLLMTDQLFFFTLNRVQWARPDKETTLSGVAGIKDRLQKSYAAYQKLMGSDHLTLTAQLCNYKYMQLSYNEWKTYEEAFPLYLSSFTHPYVRQKAEEFFQREMAKTELTLPLPEGPGMEIIHDIITRYPNRYLLIDFWGMGCGPCLMAIQSSKQLRTEIAKRDDVKLIFIADEKNVGGSETYKKYVAEWLADEDAVCLTNTDFNRLRELFQFNGIPHYETITPDGRRVCDDLAIQGYDNFDYELERLKEKLK